MFQTRIWKVAVLALLVASAALAQSVPKGTPAKTSSTHAGPTHAKAAPTLQEAEAFMKKAEDQAEDLGVRASRASWVQENFITDDTEILSAQEQERLTAVM